EYQQRIPHQVRELAVQYRVGHASPVAARRLPHRGTREHSGGEHSNTRRAASRNAPPAVPPTQKSRPAGVQETVLLFPDLTGRPACFHAWKPTARSVAPRTPSSCSVAAARLEEYPSEQTTITFRS